MRSAIAYGSLGFRTSRFQGMEDLQLTLSLIDDLKPDRREQSGKEQ